MRCDMVVVVLPEGDRRTSILNAGEPVQVETVRPKLAVEALHESVLSGLAWLNEMELDASAFCPEEHDLAGEFRPVVADNSCGELAGHFASA